MWPIEQIQTCESTQSEAYLRIQAEPQREAFVVFSLNQTAGIGRRGHDWDHCGNALAISFCWPNRLDSNRFSTAWPAWLSLLIVELLQEVCLDENRKTLIGLKWPNDIMGGGKKIGGILVQQRKVNQHSWVIAGVGINLVWTKPMPEHLNATDLQSTLGLKLDPPSFIRQSVDTLSSWIQNPLPQQWARRFSQRDIFRGRRVVLWSQSERKSIAEGICGGVDAKGQLLIQNTEGITAHVIGELSLRVDPDLCGR